jgi:phage tail sheath protein FI
LGLPSNSYTVLVAGRKIFFDTFNNQLRRISLASDVAGIMSGQEIPWESPAGFARGSLRNVIKLETLFSKTDRDELYKNQINFFTQFNDGSGTVLYGDKTLLTKPSAFDRINVRRVFIAAEKAIAKAAKYSLFEFNDEFTRSQFRNLVNPFLANLQSQRGIADFRVVCDATNNPGSVVDLNQFVADIYIKPLKSINFIQLNFIATRSDFSLTTIE